MPLSHELPLEISFSASVGLLGFLIHLLPQRGVFQTTPFPEVRCHSRSLKRGCDTGGVLEPGPRKEGESQLEAVILRSLLVVPGPLEKQ